MDLRAYLTKKRSVHQITSQCCCERLIIVVLSECHCSSHGSKKASIVSSDESVFNRLSSMPVSFSAKRRRSHMRRAFSSAKYPEVTTNIVGSSTMPNRTKGKQLIVSSDESDTEPEGVYRHTRTRTSATTPVDYSALARDIEVSEAHSTIAESQVSNSFKREAVTPRSRRYGDVMAMYIREVKTPSRVR